MQDFQRPAPQEPPPGGFGAMGNAGQAQQSAQATPLFDGAAAAEWAHLGTGGDGTQIDYDALVDVVVRPGNCWRTPEREFRPGEAFKVTLRELAAHPSALQSHGAHLAEVARNAMLAPAQQAARERVEATRAAEARKLDTTLLPKEQDAINERRLQWSRQQAAQVSTKEQLDKLRADQAIPEEVYRERLTQLIPAAREAPEPKVLFSPEDVHPELARQRPAGITPKELAQRAGRAAVNPAYTPEQVAQMRQVLADADPVIQVPEEQIIHRLHTLKILHGHGLIDDATYQRRQAAILEEV